MMIASGISDLFFNTDHGNALFDVGPKHPQFGQFDDAILHHNAVGFLQSLGSVVSSSQPLPTADQLVADYKGRI